MDAIPHIGTEAALDLVIDKIMKKEVSVPEAVQLVIGSLHSLEATSEIIEKVWVSKLLGCAERPYALGGTHVFGFVL